MVIQCLIENENQEQLKSPFEKGGFRGISASYKIPPTPPLEKGGNKNGLLSGLKAFSDNMLGAAVSASLPIILARRQI
jgi:hypothetical protein